MQFNRDGHSIAAIDKKNKRRRKDQHRPYPKWYLDRPNQVRGADFFFDAFRDLQTERRFADGPIPWSKARLYAEGRGLEPDLAELLWTVVRRLDLAERAWYSEAGKEGGDGD